nr:60S ribosomal protein L6-3 [Tanacetum cinerariifolium]
MYHKRGLWAIKAKNGCAFPKHEKKVVDAAPAMKPPKFYPADDVKKPLSTNARLDPPSSGHCQHDLISLETNIGGPFLGLLEIVAALSTANAKNIGVARVIMQRISAARLKSVFGQLALDLIND